MLKSKSPSTFVCETFKIGVTKWHLFFDLSNFYLVKLVSLPLLLWLFKNFKNPYLYVPTHLCSQTLCSQLLFPITLMYPHIYIFWRYFPIFSVSFEGFHSVLSWCGFNWCRIHGKNMQSFYLLLLQSSRANYQFLVCYWASSCFLMCWRIPSIAKKIATRALY